MALKLEHIELKDANEFIGRLHRHHKPVVGHRFSIGARRGAQLVGVAVVGRPVARLTDSRLVAEVTRLCTDGTKNACSFLYAGAARAAHALGFGVIQTFILETESGVSLLASGWQEGHMTKAEGWNRPSRGERREDQPTCRKTRWYRVLGTQSSEGAES